MLDECHILDRHINQQPINDVININPSGSHRYFLSRNNSNKSKLEECKAIQNILNQRFAKELY